MIVESVAVAYKGAPIEIQGKVKRVLDVWRQRSIFEESTQEAIEASIEGIEKARPSTNRKPLGGNLFPTDTDSSNIPASLQPLVRLQQSIEKANVSITPTRQTAEKDYSALNNGPLPSPPLLAARLSSLAKAFATVDNGVADLLKTRQTLISSLEKLVEDNKAALAEEQTQQREIQATRVEIEGKKASVEDAIMRGLATAEAEDHTVRNGDEVPPRPDIERFTPPPADDANERSTTPTGPPPLSTTGPSHQERDLAEVAQVRTPQGEGLTPPAVDGAGGSNVFEPEYKEHVTKPANVVSGSPFAEKSRNLDSRRRNMSESPVIDVTTGGTNATGGPPPKRRKTSEDFLEDLGGGDVLEGLDAEVVGMLG